MWNHVQSGTPDRGGTVAHGPAAAAQPDPLGMRCSSCPPGRRRCAVRGTSPKRCSAAGPRCGDRYTAVLVVDELAANAAEHGHRRLTLRLDLGPDLLRLQARDHGGGRRPARPCQDADPDEHGRGLAIIDALAAGWRYGATAAGWCVMVELP
ncbi:ATP-binding protein [Streptomyces sp. T1317-0309]|nr:ATP-binding protein [Streptomyces sp. T1317-0309]